MIDVTHPLSHLIYTLTNAMPLKSWKTEINQFYSHQLLATNYSIKLARLLAKFGQKKLKIRTNK